MDKKNPLSNELNAGLTLAAMEGASFANSNPRPMNNE